MSQISELIEAGADERSDFFGETIIITDFSNTTHAFTGAVFHGANTFDPVMGGYYNTVAAGAEIKTSDLAGFVPLPEMIATVGGVTLRIAPDGVTPGTFLYRLKFVARTAPSKPI